MQRGRVSSAKSREQRERERERRGRKEKGRVEPACHARLEFPRLKSRKCKQCPGNSNDGPDSSTKRRTLELQAWFVE